MMKGRTAQLKRLQRELERRRAKDERPRVQVIEVWCEGELVEVITVGNERTQTKAGTAAPAT